MPRMTPENAKNLSLAEQHDWFEKARSRRTILRGGLIGAGAMLAGPALLSGTAGAAPAAKRTASPTLLTKNSTSFGPSVTPFGRHIGYGPNAQTTMNVTWQTQAAVSNPYLRLGLTPFDLGEKIPATVLNVSTPWADITAFLDSVPPAATAAALPEEQYYIRAELTRLFPGALYYYAVGHDGYDPTNPLLGSPVYTFRTAPHAAEPFVFTAFGDQGVSYDAIGTTNLIASQQPAFHLHAGDISYAENGGDGLLTDAYDPRAWDSFFVQAASTAQQTPWMFSLGNHEMEPWYSPDGYGADLKRLALPGNGPAASPGSYVFQYGNLAVISLDPNDVSNEIPANLGFTQGVQTAWLKSTLGTLRQDPSVEFIVVFFHHCAYCTCATHGSEGGVRTQWTPLFDEFSVDLVINGHNHIYERTDPIRGGAATTVAPIGATINPVVEGTTYITAGGAGKSLYNFNAPDSYFGNVDNDAAVPGFVNEPGATEVPETVNWSRVRYTGYTLVSVSLTPTVGWTPGSLVVRGLNENGAELDQFSLVRKPA